MITYSVKRSLFFKSPTNKHVSKRLAYRKHNFQKSPKICHCPYASISWQWTKCRMTVERVFYTSQMFHDSHKNDKDQHAIVVHCLPPVPYFTCLGCLFQEDQKT